MNGMLPRPIFGRPRALAPDRQLRGLATLAAWTSKEILSLDSMSRTHGPYSWRDTRNIVFDVKKGTPGYFLVPDALP